MEKLCLQVFVRVGALTCGCFQSGPRLCVCGELKQRIKHFIVPFLA